MTNVEIKPDRRYTRDHEWAKREGAEVLVGISAFAVEQLGDITLVNVDVAAGAEVQAKSVLGTVDSVKAVSELYAPVSGRVLRVNGALEERPELLNQDCYGEGWLLALAPADLSELDQLLDAEAYQAHCREASS